MWCTSDARWGSAMRIATWNVNALPPTHRNIVLDQRYQTLPGFLAALGDICCLQVHISLFKAVGAVPSGVCFAMVCTQHA